MTIRSILIPLLAGDDVERRLEAILPFARQIEAHLDVVLISPDPIETLAYGAGTMMPAVPDLDALERQTEQTARNVEARVAAWRTRNGVPADMVGHALRTTCATFAHHVGAPDRILAMRGRLADLIVLERPDRMVGWTTGLNDAAVFDTGRPVLLIPPGVTSLASMLHTVAIGWNDSLQSTHAVIGAMPLLRRAEHVAVIAGESRAEDLCGTLPPPASWGEGICRSLRFHGIRASHRPFTRKTDEGAGAALLRQTHELDATLLVMGAYTHSRVRQFLLGGVTQHLFAHADLPLLVAH